MTNTELTDNITFLAAEQMLARLIELGLLSKEEADRVQKELRRRLSPMVQQPLFADAAF